MVAQLLIWKVELQFGLLLSTLVLSWWWGAGPERACAGVFAYMALTDKIYHWQFSHGLRIAGMDPGHSIIDITCGIAFYAIALRANRLYPLCLSSLQLVAVISHFAEEMSPSIADPIYAIMIALPSYLQLPTLLIGLLLHRRRTQSWGKYASWLDSSGRLQVIARSALLGR